MMLWRQPWQRAVAVGSQKVGKAAWNADCEAVRANAACRATTTSCPSAGSRGSARHFNAPAMVLGVSHFALFLHLVLTKTKYYFCRLMRHTYGLQQSIAKT